MNPAQDYLRSQTRRQFFAGAGLKVGGLALAGLLQRESHAAATTGQVHPALPGFPHFPAKAKRLIYLHANGAPSQLDLFDYKPGLKEHFNKELPDSVRNGQRITTMTSGQERFPVAPSKFRFRQCGQSGIWMSELVPHMQQIADEITMIKSVNTDAINHDPACTFVMTGSEVPGKPSLGSWLTYGLGSESNNLPAFVVFTPTFPKDSQAQALFTRMWSSGFLPSKFDGVALRGVGDPVLYVKNPQGVSRNDRRAMLDALNQLNQKTYQQFGDPETLTRIAQYEMAFRMQTSVPELTDLSDESQETLDMYGPDVQKPGTYASSAILARRLVERGVREKRSGVFDVVTIVIRQRPERKAAAEALSASASGRYGRAWQLAAPDQGTVHGRRPADRGVDHGPQAPRHAGRYAGRVRGRIWANGLLARNIDDRKLWAGSPPQKLLHVDGGRRHQSRHDLRRNR